MTKSKKRGLGMNAFFDPATPATQEQTAAPSAEAPLPTQESLTPTASLVPSENNHASALTVEPKKPEKIRNTFVLFPNTMKTLEVLVVLANLNKPDAKAGKVTYGDLIDEAVQALVEKKSQDEEFYKKLKAMLG